MFPHIYTHTRHDRIPPIFTKYKYIQKKTNTKTKECLFHVDVYIYVYYMCPTN